MRSRNSSIAREKEGQKIRDPREEYRILRGRSRMEERKRERERREAGMSEVE